MGEAPLDFDAIHDEYRPKLVRYLARLAGEAEAEDLAQEVLVKVHGSLSGFRGESSLSTWIYRIATNTALDRMKSASFKRETPSLDSTTATTEESACAADDNQAVDQRLIREQMNQCIRGVVDTLSPDHRAVIVLSELGELTNSEVAEILGVSPGAAKARLHRARAALRSALERACSFGRDERNEFVCEPKHTTINFKNRK